MDGVTEAEKIILVGTAVSLGLVGCASDTSQIEPADGSLLEYRDISCQDIESEAYRILRKAQELGDKVNTTAANDDAKTVVGLNLLWPALFFLEGSETEDTKQHGLLA
jgi:hypothetical protein